MLDSMRDLTVDDRGDYMPQVRQPRPFSPRRSTDPTGTVFLSSAPTQQPRSRTRSPYSRSHLRSRSSSSSMAAPAMTRAHSLPSAISSVGSPSLSPTLRPSSPLRPSGRMRSPFRTGIDDTYSLDIESISEDSELDFTPRATATLPSNSYANINNTFPRRKRPVSPLHQVSVAPSFSLLNSHHHHGAGIHTPTSLSSHSSPLLSAAKFNEPYPSDMRLPYASSSVPSTPSTARSRSPSISSLETIPDSPDAEEAAIEQDNIARLKAAADAADGAAAAAANDASRRGSGAGFAGRDKRKRWSVCGAESRQNLDLETIWED